MSSSHLRKDKHTLTLICHTFPREGTQYLVLEAVYSNAYLPPFSPRGHPVPGIGSGVGVTYCIPFYKALLVLFVLQSSCKLLFFCLVQVCMCVFVPLCVCAGMVCVLPKVCGC